MSLQRTISDQPASRRIEEVLRIAFDDKPVGQIHTFTLTRSVVALGLVVGSLLAGQATAAAITTTTPSKGQVAPGPASTTALDRLEGHARADGVARAIVRVPVGFVPEGRLGKTERERQHAGIVAGQDALAGKVARIGGVVTRRFATVPYVAVELPPEAVAGLRGLPEAAQVAADEPAGLDLAESTELIGAARATAGGVDGTGQTIAIIDTGVDSSHPFLASRVVSEACYSLKGNCPNGATTQLGPGAGAPCQFSSSCAHGTHVAGIAAGRRANGGTFDGVAPGATLIAVNAFSRCSGGGPCAYSSDLLAALERVYALRSTYAIASVNMSLGGDPERNTCDTDVLKPIIDTLAAAGIATVVSAGNEFSTTALSSPACISSAISVGSTTDSSPVDRISSFSNSAPSLDLLAPGQSIRSSVPGGGYQTMQGTSMAAPHVAGAWAVLKSRYPAWSVATVLSQLQANGLPLTDLRNGLTKPRILLPAPETFGPAPVAPIVPPVPSNPPVGRSGYWMVGSGGSVYAFGSAQAFGNAPTSSAVDLEPTPSGNGYWILDELGRVFGIGDAVDRGSAERAALAVGETATSLSATPSGGGYWIFTSRGRALAFGDAPFLGDLSALVLNGPVLDSIRTASGAGYYMVASDGGIFAFGDARFAGSMGGRPLNAPVQSLVPDSGGAGYWLVAGDGGIFAFQAAFKGSMGATPLNRPITGMVRAGAGYLMVGEDGGVFDFSGTPDGFQGSLVGTRLAETIVAVAVLEA